ncbi:MAG: type II toxin-antitoxin system RelE/ParE family toxin [Firmicutes bacterium]|nr:type II toxin-antitoxin system RelE/ParE family toxin [Bacillota bacterium]
MKNKEIIFYKRENGKVPVHEFLDMLPKKHRIKALRSLQLLEEFGLNLTEPDTKYIEDGIFELRIRFASDISRIFYFFWIDEKIIVTNGFIKKSQKLPARELERAKQYKADYERRMSHE